METITTTITDWKKLTHELGRNFAERAEQHDRDGSFVSENYKELKANKYFSAAIPEELGGGGVSHSDMCDILRIMAQYCASTALAFSMHQHLIAASVWKYRHKGESAPMLQKVAAGQLVLVSTGAKDWLESSGELIKTEGGYLLTAKKPFASQSAAGDIAMTSAPYEHPTEGWQVLHFSVPFKAEGVSILNDWDVMGMRATGSQAIAFNNVFIPESAVVLSRPRKGFHPVWDIVIGVACPLIMSVYTGIAEKGMEVAMSIGKNYQRNQQHLPYIIGRMSNTLLSARTQLKAMIKMTDDLNFTPGESLSMDMLGLKTNVSNACVQTLHEAMEAIGGQAFYRKNLLERLFRDVQACQFHPMPAWDQYYFTGEKLLSKLN